VVSIRKFRKETTAFQTEIIHELERYMRRRQCSELQRRPFKRSHLRSGQRWSVLRKSAKPTTSRSNERRSARTPPDRGYTKYIPMRTIAAACHGVDPHTLVRRRGPGRIRHPGANFVHAPGANAPSQSTPRFHRWVVALGTRGPETEGASEKILEGAGVVAQ
jgi:hypothetical protein